jgi:hypothetical protein
MAIADILWIIGAPVCCRLANCGCADPTLSHQCAALVHTVQRGAEHCMTSINDGPFELVALKTSLSW